MYGDSFIEGDFSRLENTFVKQLEKGLNSKGTDSVEVINAGVVGYGPDQEALKMQQELDYLKPDLVTVALFADNDYGDLLRDKIYKLDVNNQLTLNNYSLNPALRSKMTSAAFPKGLYRLQFFRLLMSAYQRLSYIIPNNLRDLMVKLHHVKQRLLHPSDHPVQTREGYGNKYRYVDRFVGSECRLLEAIPKPLLLSL